MKILLQLVDFCVLAVGKNKTKAIMSRCKDTHFSSEVGTFFQKGNNGAPQAIGNALRNVRITAQSLGLTTKHNATRKTSEGRTPLLLNPISLFFLDDFPMAAFVWTDAADDFFCL